MRRIEFEWLEDFTPVNPGKTALSHLEPFKKQRWTSATKLIPPHSPLGFLCAWCNSALIGNGLKKYCDEDCRRSAYMYIHPQDVSLKVWILIKRQACACAICREDFEDRIADLINRRASHAMRHTGIVAQFSSLKYFEIGHSTGDIWEVDHVLPIHKGGDGIGFDNVQVVCVKCHRKKTVTDLKR